MQKEVHVLGPLLPSNFGIKMQNGEEGSSVDIETFLGKMLLQHGERSVFFVRSLPFLYIYLIILLRFPLGLTTGHQFRNMLTNCSNPLLKRKHHLYVYIYICHCFHPMIYDSLNQIVSCAGPRATFSEHLTERIQSSGLGMMTKWSPQQFILNHPVLNPILLVQAHYLGFNRQLDGLFRMEVLIVLLNLLRAVSPCKDSSDLQVLSLFQPFFI